VFAPSFLPCHVGGKEKKKEEKRKGEAYHDGGGPGVNCRPTVLPTRIDLLYKLRHSRRRKKREEKRGKKKKGDRGMKKSQTTLLTRFHGLHLWVGLEEKRKEREEG